MSDEPERNVAPSDDDEGLMESSRHEDELPSRLPSMGSTHFPTYLVNQRRYPDRSRGTTRDAE